MRDRLLAEKIQNCTQATVKLNNGGIFNAQISRIVELVNANSCITAIELSQNNISDEGAIYLAQNLTKVNTIVLDDTDCGDAGIIAFLSSQRFKSLSFKHNLSIKNKNNEVSKIIFANTSCIALDLFDTCFSNDEREQIAKHCSSNKEKSRNSQQTSIDGFMQYSSPKGSEASVVEAHKGSDSIATSINNNQSTTSQTLLVNPSLSFFPSCRDSATSPSGTSAKKSCSI